MRQKQDNPKSRQDLLNAAQELMLAKGFGATSVDEICRKAKLTKGSFFHYFKSKDDLGAALLERFCCSTQAQMKECCSCQEKEKDPLKRVESHIDFAIKMSKERVGTKGCLIGTFAQELSDTHPQIRSMCARAFREWGKLIAADLREAKAKYKTKANFDPQDLAQHFIAIIEGAEILAKAQGDKKIVKKSLEYFRDYIKRIFN